MPKTKNNKIIASTEQIASKIFSIRNRKAMLDRDIAELYGVKSIALRQQVKRNIERFPSDFMFQLTEQEISVLVSQNVIPSKKQLGGFFPMRSQSRVWLCYPAYCAVNKPFMLIFRL